MTPYPENNFTIAPRDMTGWPKDTYAAVADVFPGEAYKSWPFIGVLVVCKSGVKMISEGGSYPDDAYVYKSARRAYSKSQEILAAEGYEDLR